MGFVMVALEEYILCVISVCNDGLEALALRSCLNCSLITNAEMHIMSYSM